jgi:N-acyl-D-aspartate/D-glutamate deacylase
VLDLVLADAEVIDGTGRPRARMDVGIAGGRIAAAGPHLSVEAARRIDLGGLVLAPGFIDLHSHHDLVFALPPARQRDLLEGRLRQGITTELVGNCGIGIAPLVPPHTTEVRNVCGFIAPDGVEWTWRTIPEWLESIERQGVLLNVATLAAHGPARAAVLGGRSGRPSEAEQSRIERWLREAVEAGAFGVSFGLIYPPGQFADTDEVAGCAGAVAAVGGFAAFHQRGSSHATLLPAVREILEVGRRSGVAVHHSHVETVGPRAWPGTRDVLRLHQEATDAGRAVSGDVIPYTAVCTTLLALLPPWALDGGVVPLLERLRDPHQRRRMREEIEERDAVWPPWEDPARFTMNIVRECGWERIRLAHVDGPANKRLEGESIASIAAVRGIPPFEALADLLLEEQGVATQLLFGISGDDRGDADLLPFLEAPHLAFVSDAWEIGKGAPHPGAYGAFPRVLGHYVRERRMIGLEEAVRRMTALPAARLGLRDRGVVRVGARADLVAFDPARIDAASDYRTPRRMARGIEHVFVNGRAQVEAGVYRPEPVGDVLRRAA